MVTRNSIGLDLLNNLWPPEGRTLYEGHPYVLISEYVLDLERLAMAVERDPHIKSVEVHMALGALGRGIAAPAEGEK